MNLQVVGCSHHGTPIAVRERLAFRPDQAAEALDQLRRMFRGIEVALLSTCNRVEVYTAAAQPPAPTREQIGGFLARFHRLDAAEVLPHLYHRSGREAAAHLFRVAGSLDSMVLGEPQILGQVKQAYQLAAGKDTAGPMLHAAFQAALRAAHRVAGETSIHQRRVSIPSVAVADFARQIFQRFDDKRVAVVGAGKMADETIRYLKEQGVGRISVVNRHYARAVELAAQWQGEAVAWDRLCEVLAAADLVVSTTGAERPVVTLEMFRQIEAARRQRPLFVLDLGVPRDFDPAIGRRPDVYLYSIDDLQQACRQNREAREQELPAAEQIVQQEADRFLAEWHYRSTGGLIEQLRQGWQKPKEDELERLLGRLPELDERGREEVRRAFDRLVNKLLHPPLESLRDESRNGVPHALADALARLFRLKD